MGPAGCYISGGRVRGLNDVHESETRNGHNRANRGHSMIEYNIGISLRIFAPFGGKKAFGGFNGFLSTGGGGKALAIGERLLENIT